MTNKMVGSVLTLVTLLFNVEVAAAQTYTQMQWGMNKGVTPYQFGANINGTWSNLGTVNSSGAWGINPYKVQILDISPYANDHRFNMVVNQTVANDSASANINRSSGITGGTNGFINSGLRVINNVFNSEPYNAATNPYGRGCCYDGKPYEWGVTSILNNGRTYNSSGYKGQNGAGLFAGYRKKLDAGPTWGTNTIVFDWPGLENPASDQITVAAEFDVHADGNVATRTGDVNRTRVGVSSFIKSTTSSDLAPSGFGIGTWAFFVGEDPGISSINTGNWYSKWKIGYYALGLMDTAIDVSDTANAGATTPYLTPVALRMSADQQVAFVKDGSRNMRYSAFFSSLCYETAGSYKLCIADTGTINSLAGANFDGPVTAKVGATVGVAGTSVGTIAFKNATSGTITLQPTTGALGTVTATLPANTGVIAETNLAQTWTATQTFDATIKLKSYIVATLPTCDAGAEGSLAYVTDATAPTYNGALTGGGSVKVPVFCNGAAWTAH
jgi:hypothetical protein